jgi:hypothetical protein
LGDPVNHYVDSHEGTPVILQQSVKGASGEAPR